MCLQSHLCHHLLKKTKGETAAIPHHEKTMKKKHEKKKLNIFLTLCVCNIGFNCEQKKQIVLQIISAFGALF